MKIVHIKWQCLNPECKFDPRAYYVMVPVDRIKPPICEICQNAMIREDEWQTRSLLNELVIPKNTN